MEPVRITEHEFEYGTSSTPPARTGLLHTHPYLFAVGSLVALIVIGLLLVARSAPAQLAPSSIVAWGGAGAVVDPSASQGGIDAVVSPPVQQQPPYTYVLPTLAPASGGSTDGAAGGGFDYEAFIAELTHQSTGGATTPAQPSASSDAYAYIPTGLVSIDTAPKRTQLQQALYDYGNEVGSLIQAFEQEHPNMTQVLTAQIQDRTDTGKGDAVVRLGNALSVLGDSMLAMDSVPTQLADAHTAVANSYKGIGAKLALVPKAQGDSAYIDAINTYNAAADTFVRNYVALAQLFVAYGVTFSSNDPGNVFTFTNASGL